MKNIVLSFLTAISGTLLIFYLFFSHYVKVVDGVKVLRSLESPLLKDAMQGGMAPEVLARRRALIYKAFKKAIDEEKGVVFVSQGILKSPFEDRTDEVLERTRYWYAYFLSIGRDITSEGGNKQGRKPE